MNKINIQWLQNNPIVKVWRDLNENSYIDTLDYINSNWNTNDYSYEKVSSTLDLYLKELESFIRLKTLTRSKKERNEGQRVSKLHLMNRYKLNQTEANYLIKRIYG